MVLAVIPARYASTRFPGKPLVMLGEKSMIQRVYDQVMLSECVDRVVVATDDERIFLHVQQFGGMVIMTRADHQSGTDRCAEIATHFPEATWIINVQGDEPFIQPEQIDLLYVALIASKNGIATLAKKENQQSVLLNPNIVKVVINQHQEALYFSRFPIPFARNTPEAGITGWKHIGMYGFNKSTLFELAKLEPTALEQTESLEQLRWLDHGYRIAVGQTTMETIGIDTPEDLYAAAAFL